MRSITLNVYRRDEARLQTQIDVTNEHIDLIATSEQYSSLSQRGTTLYSQLEVTASGIESKVGKNEIFSVINQAADSLKIAGKKLDLNGNTYANGNFVVGVDGNVEITGKVTASSGRIANWVIGSSWIYQQRDIESGGTTTRYQLILNAPDPLTPTTNGIVIRNGTLVDGAVSSWNDQLVIKHNGAVYAKALHIEGGDAGGFTFGTNFIRKQVDVSNVRYEVSLYAPSSPIVSGDNATNAITVRHGAISSGSVPAANWVNDFTVKYDGSINSLSVTDSDSRHKGVTIHKGRLKYYYGTNGTTWIGEWATGLYTISGSPDRNAIYLGHHANNAVGFAIQSATETTATPYFYYEPNLNHVIFKSPITAVNLNDQVNLVNAIRVSAQEFYVYSGTKGYCVHGLNDTTNYYQIKYNSATNLGLYVNGGNTATFAVTTSSSDERLKENIRPIQNGILEKISNVELKEFSFKKDEKKKLHFGAIAQDVEEAVGEYDSELVFALDGDPNGYLNLNYTEFLILRLVALEKRVKELENERSNV